MKNGFNGHMHRSPGRPDGVVRLRAYSTYRSLQSRHAGKDSAALYLIGKRRFFLLPVQGACHTFSPASVPVIGDEAELRWL